MDVLDVQTRVELLMRQEPLHLAAKGGDAEKCKRLILNEGANANCVINGPGFTPLHIAAAMCVSGSAMTCAMLLRLHAEVNAKDGRDLTPLHAAAASRSHYTHVVNTCRVLLDRGADINEIAKTGVTPLHLAAMRGNIEVCQLLLKRGADIHAKDELGRTPLDIVAADPNADPRLVDLMVVCEGAI